ncbi:MAG: ATP-grasp domain-containing protein [Ruminococcaceae bacterium]|nr:ATP-grasp domain-containing protein [Oscillospiraceae bacterium]
MVNYFKDVLNGKGKVFVANSSELSPAFRVADGCVVTPLIYDENYIPFLIEYCKKNNIKVIISLFDIDLPILSKNKELFNKNGINVIVSNLSTVEICNDKWKTYLFLLKNNFNVPKTYIDLAEAEKDIKEGELSFPLFVKPRWGMGSISVFKADNIDELTVFYKKVKREVHNTYLKYESSIDKDHCVLIQQKINGQEYGMDVINDLDGLYQNTIVKKKIAMRAGETDCAQTVNNGVFEKTGRELSKHIKHISNLDVDVFLSDNNEVFVLEMNARFGGGYPFSHMAGVNLPKAIINWINNEENDKRIFDYKENCLLQKDINIIFLNE